MSTTKTKTKTETEFWVYTTVNSVVAGVFGPFSARREAEQLLSGLGAAVAAGKITSARIEARSAE